MSSPDFAADDASLDGPPVSDQPVSHGIDHSKLPTLYADRSFWGMTITQFFGAFNDNLFKQVVLLLAVSVAAAAAGAEEGGLLNKQAIAMLVFSIPFVLFSTFFGFISDRFSKTRVIVLAKVAELVIMLMGLAAFLTYDTVGFTGLCIVLFFMGTQSAFFGPGKYGILPETLREADLPRANGIFLMTSFFAIIMGMAAAGWLAEKIAGIPDAAPGEPKLDADKLWIVSVFCVAVALVGTVASLFVRKAPPANPTLKFTGLALAIPADMRQMLAGDRLLLLTLAVASMFWLIGAMVQPTVNEFGLNQLQLNNAQTSYLAAALGVGIALGCLAAGMLSKDQVKFGLARIGIFGVIACLVLLGLPGTNQGHMWGYRGSFPWMVGLGASAGLFVVPLQVFVQARPPENKKGRMIAVMNLCTWTGIIIGAVLVQVIDIVQKQFGLYKASSFLFIAALMLPIALFYHPKDQHLREGEEDE